MTLSDLLSSFTDAVIRHRGRSYFNSGYVRLKTTAATQVTALVKGSSYYQVQLTLDDQTIDAHCNCAYCDDRDEICKHIWATILAAESTVFGKNAVQKQVNCLILLDHEVQPSSQTQKKPPPRETWPDQLAELSRRHQSLTPPKLQLLEMQPIYIFDLASSETSQKLSFEVNVRERKKDGAWGKPKLIYISQEQIEGIADPHDRELLTLLSGSETAAYSYSTSRGAGKHFLSGTMIKLMLPLLARSGRVFLRRETLHEQLQELTPDLDATWMLRMGIARDPSERWVLAGTMQRGEESMPLSEPSLIVPGLVVWNGKFSHFDHGGGMVWISALRRGGSISVPATKADEFIEQLLQMPNLPKLEIPAELSYTEESVTPQPRLVLRAIKKPYVTSPLMLELELSFNYGGSIVKYRPTTRGVLNPESKRFLIRDAEAERAAEATLALMGARPNWNGIQQTLQIKVSQLSNIARELMAAGWSVEAEGKLYRPAGKFEMSVKSGQDWFDLNGSADFDGKSVPFPNLLASLKRGESTIILDDGTLGMIPEEWLKKFGLIAAMGTIEGESLRFSKGQVGVLDALLASRPEVTFDARFGRAREQLAKFQGVEAADPPAQFQGELREYQREGLGWMRFLRKFGFGGCLADEMGLGKTVQVIALLSGKRKGPSLVVVPKSLIFNWKQEVIKFAPKLKVLDHTGGGRDRSGGNFKDFDIILTTYGTLRNDAEAFAEVRFDTCILDESQAAKNASTETAKAVRIVKADHRLALSGTPVENHLGELWTLFDFLNPGMLGNALPAGNSAKNPDSETREFLARALKPYILRRTKNQVAKDLPEKTEQTVFCDLEPAQRKLYNELRDHYRQSLLTRVDEVGLGRSKIQVLEALLRLRQAACHPGLIDKAKSSETSAKLEVLLPQLRELAESGHKALVFSQFTSLLSIVKQRLDAEKVVYEYLDGKTRDRQGKVDRFQTDPDCHLFLISLKAGGVGLNLTAAEYVFLLDPWWNPAVEAQAIDRSHRIGQTKSVFAYRLIARDTVEEKVLALQASKRALADAILGGDGKLMTDLKREDLELLLS